MNPRKRQASESLPPLRSSKYTRTTAAPTFAGNTSIVSRWLSLGKEAWQLGRDTISQLLPVRGPLVSRSSLSALNSPASIPPRLRRSSRSPSSMTSNTRTAYASLLVSMSPTSENTPDETDTPVPIPVVRKMFANDTSVPISANANVPTTEGSDHNREGVRDPLPPPSFPHQLPVKITRKQSPTDIAGVTSPPALDSNTEADIEQPKPRVDSTSHKPNGPVSPPKPSSENVRHVLNEALGVASDQSGKLSLARPYTNREHIHAKQHKAQVRAERKKDMENTVKELHRLSRSTGYTADFKTFQGWLLYKATLERQERHGGQRMLPPSPSLTDLRSKPAATHHRRTNSLYGGLSDEFLERAIQRARNALNGPRPPKPYAPTIDQLRVTHLAKNKEIDRRLHGPKFPTALPPQDEREVETILKKRGTISKFEREQVNETDISRLRPCQWLNDEIINFYGAMLLARSNSAKENPLVNGASDRHEQKVLNVHYFSTFFWPKLKGEGYEKGRLAKWTKKCDIFSKDAILIPINHNNCHWTAAAINFRRKRIESYDSMNMYSPAVFKHLRSYLDAEHRNKKKTPFDFSGWEDYIPEDTPQQENGYDCGIFTCQILEILSRGEETFNFGQRNMPYIRRRMIWEIGNATLRADV